MNEIEVSKKEKIETYILEQQIEKEDTGKYKVLMAKWTRLGIFKVG